MSIPKHLAGDKFVFKSTGDHDFGKIYVEGMFIQNGSNGIAVVGVITYIAGVLKGWKAYMGASPARTEEQVLEDVASWGNKLGYEQAAAYFPDTKHYPREAYDNGW